jgi:hypothetical protein
MYLKNTYGNCWLTASQLGYPGDVDIWNAYRKARPAVESLFKLNKAGLIELKTTTHSRDIGTYGFAARITNKGINHLESIESGEIYEIIIEGPMLMGDYMNYKWLTFYDINDLNEIKTLCHKNDIIPKDITINNKRFNTKYYIINSEFETCKSCKYKHDYETAIPCELSDNPHVSSWKCPNCAKNWFHGNKRCNLLNIKSSILNSSSIEKSMEYYINLLIDDEFIQYIKNNLQPN